MDRFRKDKGKSISGKKRHAKESHIEIGDEIVVWQKKQNELTTPFNPLPLTVLEQK